MLIAATKKMVNELNKAAKAAGRPEKFGHVTMTPDSYKWNVSMDIFGAYDYGDYSYNTGMVRAIRVEYPADWYACDGYITTKQLNKLYRAGDTVETFTARVLEEIEI